MNRMRLDWARHGQNVANVTETLSFRAFDGDLTDLGCEQASQLGRRLAQRKEHRPKLLVSSPLRRARQTAEVVGGHLGLEIALELDELRELNVGELDGRNDAESWSIYNRVLDAWRAGDHAARFPGGEDCTELAQRLRSACALIADKAFNRPVLVVAHGANLRAALPLLTGVSDPGYDLQTGGIAGLQVTPGAAGSAAITLEAWGTGAARPR